MKRYHETFENTHEPRIQMLIPMICHLLSHWRIKEKEHRHIKIMKQRIMKSWMKKSTKYLSYLYFSSTFLCPYYLKNMNNYFNKISMLYL